MSDTPADGPSPVTVIKLHDDGPLRVKGPVTVLDPDGNAFGIKRKTFFLCRCGRSKNKPFCDSSHSECFEARERAAAPVHGESA